VLLGGTTCSGKTALAIALAERFDAEIVGADSRQIYRGMPIGTAAPTAAELVRVPHHLVGFLDPHERYSAARFACDALAAIDDIHARGKRALVVGGTGFYLRALAGDVALSGAYDRALRERLAREARVHPPEVLHAWLASRDPARANTIAPTDRYRVARALEIALGSPSVQPAPTPEDARASLRARGLAAVKLVLAGDAETLDARIANRVDGMLAAGFVAESERVGSDAVAADAVGYPQVAAYLAGWLCEAGLRAAMIRATRRYAKRQATWFRGEPGAESIAPGAVVARLAALAGWET